IERGRGRRIPGDLVAYQAGDDAADDRNGHEADERSEEKELLQQRAFRPASTEDSFPDGLAVRSRHGTAKIPGRFTFARRTCCNLVPCVVHGSGYPIVVRKRGDVNGIEQHQEPVRRCERARARPVPRRSIRESVALQGSAVAPLDSSAQSLFQSWHQLGLWDGGPKSLAPSRRSFAVGNCRNRGGNRRGNRVADSQWAFLARALAGRLPRACSG